MSRFPRPLACRYTGNFVKEGKLVAMKNSIEKFTETGVVLRDGTELPADIVVYGTGFKKNYDLLDRLLQQKLPMERDGLYLYRNILAPRLPDLAFVGSEVPRTLHRPKPPQPSLTLTSALHLPSPPT